MKRVAVIALVSYLALVLEFLMYNFWGKWGCPSLSILVVIFFNLYLGIRFSIIAAVFCGIFQDSLGLSPFGTHVLVYVAGSYATTLVRRYVYQPGSRFSRAVVTFFVVVACFGVEAVLTNMSHELQLGALLTNVLIPQLLATMIAATWIYAQLKNIGIFFKLKS